ncbi:MAG: pilus assembly protein N-terminal domain-containing protein [Pseudomonadota bacterium]
MSPRRSARAAFAAAALAAFASLGPVKPAGAQPMALVEGQAEVLTLPRPPGTVVVGDETVVAANVTATGGLVLTARSPGATNVIVLDQEGAEMERYDLRVRSSTGAVTIRRGVGAQTLICDPSCRAAE